MRDRALTFLKVFGWEGDQQNVVALRKRSCAFAQNGVELAAATKSPAYVNLNYAGTFFFSSSLPDHCTAGQLFAISVTPREETPGKHQLLTLAVLRFALFCTLSQSYGIQWKILLITSLATAQR